MIVKGKYTVSTSKPQLVRVGPGLQVRFSMSHGFIAEDGSFNSVSTAEGCLGHFEGEQFVWQPPMNTWGKGNRRFLITVSPDLQQSVIKALEAQGVVEKYRERLAREIAERQLTQAQDLTEVHEVGQYVVD